MGARLTWGRLNWGSQGELHLDLLSWEGSRPCAMAMKSPC